MIRVVRYLSTQKGNGIKEISNVTNKYIWKGIPDYDLDVNPYKIEVIKNTVKVKKDEKNKSNT